jgi:hypothetical protein
MDASGGSSRARGSERARKHGHQGARAHLVKEPTIAVKDELLKVSDHWSGRLGVVPTTGERTHVSDPGRLLAKALGQLRKRGGRAHCFARQSTAHLGLLVVEPPPLECVRVMLGCILVPEFSFRVRLLDEGRHVVDPHLRAQRLTFSVILAVAVLLIRHRAIERKKTCY